MANKLNNKEYWIAPATIDNSTLIESQGREYVSISNLAKTVLCFELAKQKTLPKPEPILTTGQAISALYTFLTSSSKAQNLLALNPDNYDWQTTKIIYQSLNLIRMNQAGNMPTDRIKRIQKLADWFENYLQKLQVLDYPLLIKRSWKEVQNWTQDHCFFSPVVLTTEAKKTLSNLEKQFVQSLIQLTGGKEESLSKSDGTLATLDLLSEKTHFFSGYGISNEIKYVINEINTKQLPYSSVAIYYSHEEYEPFLISELEGRGFPTTFITGRSVKNHNLFQLVLDLITWIESDYHLDFFYPILNNPLLVSGGSLLYFLSSRKTEYQLGNDLARYQEFYRRYQKEMPDDAASLFTGLLTFSQALTIHEFLNQIQELGKSKLVRKSERLNKDLTLLETIQNDFGLLPEKEQNYKLLKEKIEDSTLKESEDPSAIRVEKLTGFTALTRENSFFLGLSQKDMQIGKKQQILFRDRDLESLKSTGFLPTKKNRRKTRNQQLIQTISTNPEKGTLYLGYSTYDTAKFLNQNPAGIYSELFRKIKPNGNGKDIPNFCFGHPEEKSQKLTYVPLSKEWSFREIESPSSLETFADCPRKYYYKYQERYRSLELTKVQPDQWLDAVQKGLLVHEFLKAYMDAVFLPVTYIEISSNPKYQNVDSVRFNQIFNEVSTKYQTNIPADAEWVIHQELEDLRPDLFAYLQEVHQSLTHPDTDHHQWEYLAGEYTIEVPMENCISIPDLKTKNNLTGTLDRIDCWIEEQSGGSPKNIIHLRILDYKTGKMNRFQKKISAGTKLQMGLYPAMLSETSTQEKLLGLVQKKYHKNYQGYSVQVDEFAYIFPLDFNLEADPPEVNAIFYTVPAKDQNWDLRLKYVAVISQRLNSFPKQNELEQYRNTLQSDPDFSGQEEQSQLTTLKGMLKGCQKDELCQYCDYKALCGKEAKIWNQ